MEWFKKHIDAVIVLGGILASVFWMNGKFSQIEKDLAIVKTVLIMKGIMPSEVAIQHEVKTKE